MPRKCFDGFTALEMFEAFRLEREPQFLHIIHFKSVALAASSGH
jgi:hypothetical protein